MFGQMVAIAKVKDLFYIVENKYQNGKGKRRYVEALGRISRREAELVLARYKVKEKRVLLRQETFSEVAMEFERKYKGEARAVRTFESFEYWNVRFLRFFGSQRLQDIQYQEIENFKEFLRQRKLGNRTINIALLNLKKIFEYAVRTARISQIPIIDTVSDVRHEDVKRLWPDEIKRLLEKATCPLQHYIVVMLGTGMRPKEFRDLEWKDISFSENVIHVRTVFEKKRGRKIPMTDRVLAALLDMKHNEKPYPWKTESAPKQALKRLEKCLGVVNLSPYVFRKTFASVMSENGVERHQLSDIMGNSPDTLKKYYLNIHHETYRGAMSNAPI